jgi:hypothetical protein
MGLAVEQRVSSEKYGAKIFGTNATTGIDRGKFSENGVS